MPLVIVIIVVIIVAVGFLIYWKRQRKRYALGNRDETLEEERELKKINV